jgi:hypothetical protein
MNAHQVNAWLATAWSDYPILTAVVTAAGLVLLLAVLIRARVGKSASLRLQFLGTNLSLVFLAEGMYEVLTEDLHLHAGFVWLLFAVFEITLVTAMKLAREQYERTTTRYPDGHAKVGQVDQAGHPGPMLRVVWLIALSSAAVVTTNAKSGTEVLLRLALPIIVVTMWWATLTAEGQGRRGQRRFAFSPITLMEERGWLVPADRRDDLDKLRRDRRVRLMTAYGHRLASGGWLARRAARRLARLALRAEPKDLAEVERRVRLAEHAVRRVAPGYVAGRDKPSVTAWYRPWPSELPHLNTHEVAELAHEPQAQPGAQAAHDPARVLRKNEVRPSVDRARKPQRKARDADRKVRDEALAFLRTQGLAGMTGRRVAAEFGMSARWGEGIVRTAREGVPGESENGRAVAR